MKATYFLLVLGLLFAVTYSLPLEDVEEPSEDETENDEETALTNEDDEEDDEEKLVS